MTKFKKSYLYWILITLALAIGLLYVKNELLYNPPFEPNKEIKLEFTESPQDAAFYISPGFVGGGGSAPILDKSGDRPLKFNGKSIFFDESELDRVLKEGKKPDCVGGQEFIYIEANITLTPRTRVNYSIPPDKFGQQPEINYYEAVLNKLYKVSINYERCGD